jgi:hypothetical protein
MAMVGINPVQPAQQIQKSKGGKLGRPLGALGALVGGVGGGLAGAAAGPLGIAKGATLGAAQGAGAGYTLGNLIDPQRTTTETIGPKSMGGVGGFDAQSLAQKYKMSDAGRMALEGLAVVQQNPQYRDYIEPLGLAVMQDIGANNRQRMA